MNNVDLQSILTSHQIVAINVAGSSAAGSILSFSELNDVINECDKVLHLEEQKTKALINKKII